MAVADVWSRVLERGSVAAADDLFDLGADSLQVARMHVELEQRFGIEMPTGLLFAERTPARVAAWIAAHAAPSRPSAATAGTKLPIFFVASATGRERNSLRIARLGSAIDPERRAHEVIVPQRLTASAADDSDEAARTARTCIATARAEQPRGPYLLAGVAGGGGIAHEMARQWERAGEDVHLLLIESRNLAASADDARTARAPQRDAPFGGTVTLIANREALAEHVGLGWGGVFGDRLRVLPIARHERPRRMQTAIAEAVRAWLAEVE